MIKLYFSKTFFVWAEGVQTRSLLFKFIFKF